MAVVSISRIQIRRGRKNSDTGLPQLSSGEFGWAIDTQELFIGNGSVAEGSPYVGNTKILSEHDNIFEFATNYSYRGSGNVQTGRNENDPVRRSLQARLDDRVSIRSFGVTGDESTIVTQDLQRALDQLYLNTNKSSTRSRVELILEPGTYTIDGPLHVPPYATIRGAGAEKTVIKQNAQHPVFIMINSLSTPGNYLYSATDSQQNQSRHLTISDLTIESVSGTEIMKLQATRDSYFKNLRIRGTFTNGEYYNGFGDSSFTDIGILLESLATDVTCQNIIFDNITIEGCGYAVRSKHDIKDNTWTNCKFIRCSYGFEFGEETLLGVSGQNFGPRNNIIEQCVFNDIDRHGIFVTNGSGNLSRDNKFYRTGNNAGNDSNATYSVINFVSKGNSSDNDWFERTEALAYDQQFINGTVYVPEVEGGNISNSSYTHVVNLSTVGEYQKLFRLPADSTKSFEVDYMYVSDAVDAQRTGKLSIIVVPGTDTAFITDDYDYIGDNQYAENLIIRADLVDEDIDGTLDTVAVNVLNSTGSDDAKFYYRVTTKL